MSRPRTSVFPSQSKTFLHRALRATRLSFFSLLCIGVCGGVTYGQAKPPAAQSTFVGSKQCQRCHTDLYASWQKTRMANIVRDPRLHPEAVLGDFTHPNPLVTFGLDKVAFVYGSRYKQRYFTRIGDDYYVLPAQWDVAKKKWLPFHVPDTGSDWWTAHYPSDNMQRPTGPLCDGCHSVNYNIATKQVTEWNVGCEKCHGPGSLHVAHPTKANIVNPQNLDPVRGNDICMQCHTQGQPKSNPIAANSGPGGTSEAKYYDWPVGFLPGDRLSDFWTFEDHRLGETTFYHFADGTAHKNRMQGNDFAQSVMAHREIRCFDCHNVHSDKHPSDLVDEGNDLCLGCHRGRGVPGPGIYQTLTEHTHHAANSPGSQCTACHMPKIEQTIPGNYVAAHTFKFISPRRTEQFKEPNACNQCHTDKTPAWALQQLSTWQSVSPWSVLQ